MPLRKPHAGVASRCVVLGRQSCVGQTEPFEKILMEAKLDRTDRQVLPTKFSGATGLQTGRQ